MDNFIIFPRAVCLYQLRILMKKRQITVKNLFPGYQMYYHSSQWSRSCPLRLFWLLISLRKVLIYPVSLDPILEEKLNPCDGSQATHIFYCVDCVKLQIYFYIMSSVCFFVLRSELGLCVLDSLMFSNLMMCVCVHVRVCAYVQILMEVRRC